MTHTGSPSWKVGALGFEGSFLIPRPMLSATQVSAGGTVAELWPRNGVGWKRGGSQAQRAGVGGQVGSGISEKRSRPEHSVRGPTRS